MFFKITKGKNKDYLYLVEGYRDKNNKVRHKKLMSFGSLDQLDPGFVKSLIKSTKSLFNNNLSVINTEDAQVLQSINWGSSRLVKQLWKEFNLDSLMVSVKKNTR